MKSFTPILFIISLVLGLALGWQVKLQTSSTEEEPLAKSSRNELPTSNADHLSGKSPDSAPDLHALPAAELYDRMALFLLDAKPEDFPAFYEEFQKREDRNADLDDLLFIAWTRLDPEAAIEAARGTDDFKYAYWAWACHDPGAALATAKERGEGLENVVLGIGEFHPRWLSENWDLIPEDQREIALQGLAKWPDTETPESSLRLLFKSGKGSLSKVSEETLLALARQDPAHAYEVIKELTRSHFDHRSRAEFHTFLTSVSKYEPALLDDLVAASKNPVDQNQIRFHQFENLLRQDPVAARAMLDETPASWLKEDLSVNYSNHLMSKDPAKGYEYAISVLKNGIVKFDRSTTVRGEHKGSHSSHRIEGTGQLISDLVDYDAPAVLNELRPETEMKVGFMRERTAFDHASVLWSNRDLEGYAEWLGDQDDHPTVYQNGASNIVRILQEKKEYAAGIEWAQRVPVSGPLRIDQVRQLYFEWVRHDHEAATAWRQSDKFTGDPKEYPILPAPKTQKSE